MILDDGADENMEIMSGSLSFPGLAPERVLLQPNTTIIQIHDDDGEMETPCIVIHFLISGFIS